MSVQLDMQREEELHQLAGELGLQFQDLTLLNQALRHTSYCNENNLPAWESNERLEFLGDAVLDMVISQVLFDHFAEASEGQLSRARAGAVNEHRLAATASRLGLGNYLLLGRGEMLHGGREKSSILADAFEALIAALYLDAGMEAVKGFVLPLLEEAALGAIERSARKDYKTRLQEEVQAAIHATPEYHVESTEGPDHAKTFHVVMQIDGEKVANGQGRSKKEAEQDAARRGLVRWNHQDDRPEHGGKGPQA